MKKVVVVIANTRWFEVTIIMEIPLSVPIIAAELSREGIEYDIIDCNGNDYSPEQCLNMLKESCAEMVLIPALLIQHYKHYAKAAELAKSALPEVLTVMGGAYPTSLYNSVMADNNVDYVFLGYAE